MTLVRETKVLLIKSFTDKEADKIWSGTQSRKLPANIQNVARRKLRMINNAQNINDLRIPPANHLEKLSGNLEGFHSIRINKQWRIMFNGKMTMLLKFKLLTTTKLKKRDMKKLENIHPGEILKEEFLDPMEITAYRLSKDTFIPQTRVSEIIKKKRRITADTALRLSKYFGTTAKFWLGLQDDYDLEEEKLLKQNELNNIKPMKNNAA